MGWLPDATAWILPVILAVTLHEAAHGWMAEKFGDLTARIMGRVSFNPMKHIDQLGTIIIPGLLLLAHMPFLFGYAKPVPVDFRRLKPPRIGMLMVALAGPASNILQALIAGVLLHAGKWIRPEQVSWLFLNLYRAILVNCLLAMFNMIPILPLDGGRVIDALLIGWPRRIFQKLDRYGMILVVLALVALPLMGVNMAQNVIGPPMFWLVKHILWITGNSDNPLFK